MKKIIEKNHILIYLLPVSGVAISIFYIYYNLNLFENVNKKSIVGFLQKIGIYAMFIIILILVMFNIFDIQSGIVLQITYYILMWIIVDIFYFIFYRKYLKINT